MKKEETDESREGKRNRSFLARIRRPLPDRHELGAKASFADEEDDDTPAHTTATYWG